jgi:hypothetical protein
MQMRIPTRSLRDYFAETRSRRIERTYMTSRRDAPLLCQLAIRYCMSYLSYERVVGQGGSSSIVPDSQEAYSSEEAPPPDPGRDFDIHLADIPIAFDTSAQEDLDGRCYHSRSSWTLSRVGTQNLAHRSLDRGREVQLSQLVFR